MPLAELAARYLSLHRPSEPLLSVVELIGEGTSLPVLAGRTETRALRDRGTQKYESVEFVLFIIRSFLADHALSLEEAQTLRSLKRLLGVDEGDLLHFEHQEVRLMVAAEVSTILADGRVDRAEGLHQSALQEALGLGYDEYVELAKIPIQVLIDRLFAEASASGLTPIGPGNRASAWLLTLDTYFPLPERQRALLYSFPAGTTSMKELELKVKDAIWRRDSGICTRCGALQQLTFVSSDSGGSGAQPSYADVKLRCALCR